MPPIFELSLANLLPPATLLTLVSGIWSLYFFLHLLPLLQLNTPLAHYDHEMARRGWRHFFVCQALTALLLVSFFRASLTMPGDVPEGEAWRFGTFKDPNITQEVKFSGERRRCKHCLIYKPDRCHHCRICKSCILKMDHHCPWIMNCIGFRNHKYFFLLIIYSMLCCAFIGVTVIGTILESLEQEMPVCQRFLLLLCFSTSSIMGGLLVVFAAFHVMLMLRGLTTIEFCEKMSIVTSGKSSKYDMGAYRNITAVFGPRPYLWFLPVDPPAGDGLRFAKPRGRSLAAPRYLPHDPEWKRRGDEGHSGQRCPICQKLALEAGHTWRQAKTTKPGSPYHYIGTGSQGQAPEKKVLEVISRKVCNRNALTQLPNPRRYTLHHPTLQFECDDVLETFGESLIDALTLGEDLATFCWDIDICGSRDEKFFDFEPEDDDDDDDEDESARSEGQDL